MSVKGFPAPDAATSWMVTVLWQSVSKSPSRMPEGCQTSVTGLSIPESLLLQP